MLLKLSRFGPNVQVKRNSIIEAVLNFISVFTANLFSNNDPEKNEFYAIVSTGGFLKIYN